jgi:membrane-bound ClpP family serine protease
MIPILLLFLVGIALLAADVFASSFVLAIGGAASMAGGCVVAYHHFGAAAAGLAGLAAFALLGLTIYLELSVLPKTRLGRGLVVESTTGSTSQPPPPEASTVVGKPAEAVTTLAPSGYVTVEGRRYEAFCQTGHASKGSALLVVGVDNFRLIVSKPS